IRDSSRGQLPARTSTGIAKAVLRFVRFSAATIMPTTASTWLSHTGVPLKPGSTAKPVSLTSSICTQFVTCRPSSRPVAHTPVSWPLGKPNARKECSQRSSTWASEIVASIGSWRSPQQNTSGEQLPRCHAREIERHQSLWFLRRVIGKIEGASHDMGTGEDLSFTHEEARANDLSIGGEDTHK